MCIRDRLHIPAIAHEMGFEIDADTFDRMHRGAHYLLDIRPAGKWPAQFFYYTGGVPAVMEEIKSMLHPVSYTHLDVYKRQGLKPAGDRRVRPGPGAERPRQVIAEMCIRDSVWHYVVRKQG